MPHLLILPRLRSGFERSVRPLLQARGLRTEQGTNDLLGQLLCDRARLWVYPLNRPRAGVLRAVEIPARADVVVLEEKGRREKEGREQMFLLPVDDCLLELPLDRAGDRPEPALLQVGGACGRRFAAEVLPAAAAPPAETDRHLVLLLTTAELTVLLEVAPAGDAFVACEMWPNERLPLGLLSHRRGFYLPEPGEALAPLFLDWEHSLWFARCCETCGGGGKVTCRKCSGTGDVACHSTRCQAGIFRPASICEGGCHGSGEFTYPNGNKGVCRRCKGVGRFPAILCGTCGGTSKVTCSACHGTTLTPCRACAEAGSVRVDFDPVQGFFSQRRPDGAGPDRETRLSPELVYLFDRATRTRLAHAGDAPALREKLCQAYEKAEQHQNAFEPLWAEHVRTIGGLKHCLTLSMHAADLHETGQVRVSQPEPSTHRSAGGLCLDVRISGSEKSWVTQGLLPFPAASPVKIFAPDDHKCTTPLPLPLQGPHQLSEDGEEAARVAGCYGEGKSYRLTLRFPQALDPNRLPHEFYLRLDAPPAAELAQKKVLEQWCGPENRDSPALNAMILPPASVRTPALEPRVGRIDASSNPAQHKALALALSEAPLALIKGPPGTGKTTLIEEIVNQLTLKGQRVLVCSQSHDAVRNVLDNLDRRRMTDPARALRMLRHGREEKLSPSELFYSTGQLQRSYPELVRTRTAGRRATLLSKINGLSEQESAADQAQGAAQDLEATQQRLAQERARARAQYEQKMAALQGEQDAGLAQAGQSHAADAQGPVENLRASGTRLAELRQQQSQLEEDVKKAHERFRARTNREPRVVAVPDSTRRKLRDSIVPGFMVGTDALEQRYSLACESWREGVEKVGTEERTIAALEAELNRLSRLRANREAAIRQRAREGQENAGRLLEAQLAAWQLEESAHQSAAATVVAQARAAFPEMPHDSLAAALWRQIRGGLSDGIGLARSELNFNLAWLQELESPEAGEAVAEIYFRHVQVYFATCVGVRSWKRLLHLAGGIDLVIVDEAGQATIPQTLGPMLLGKRSLLIGDERQLPPIGLTGDLDLCRNTCDARPPEPAPAADLAAASAPAAVMRPCWLERSFFEYLWLDQPRIPREMLQKQFRMHPDIADFVAAVFYPEGLTNGVTAEERQLQFGEFSRAVCLVSTSGQKGRFESSPPRGQPGLWNDLEVEKVRQILQRAEAGLTSAASFGIVTPYSHQVDHLKKAMEPLLTGFHHVRLQPQTDIASVDRFQGSERDVIIISFVRSPKLCPHCRGQGKGCVHCRGRGFDGPGLTFSRDLRRLNVAFSRARKMLILVGDFDILADPRLRGGLAGARVLQRFVEHVRDRGKVLHVWETEDNSRES